MPLVNCFAGTLFSAITWNFCHKRLFDEDSYDIGYLWAKIFQMKYSAIIQYKLLLRIQFKISIWIKGFRLFDLEKRNVIFKIAEKEQYYVPDKYDVMMIVRTQTTLNIFNDQWYIFQNCFVSCCSAALHFSLLSSAWHSMETFWSKSLSTAIRIQYQFLYEYGFAFTA